MKRFFYFSPMRLPPFLKKGDKIALVSPAKKIQTDLQPSIDIIKNWGLTPVIGTHALATHHYFAGADAQRLSDLQWALDDPEIKAILITRGGYGTTRILDDIDWTKFDRNPKWLCGFSDITALLSTLNNKDIACLHGPLAVTLTWDQESTESLRSALFDGEMNYTLSPHSINKSGITRAPLIGGNLSIICNSIGTSSQINTKNKILFLEDVGEYYYHLDRMLTQMARAGLFKQIKGLIIGDFSSMKDHRDSFGKEPLEIIADHFAEFDIPQVFNFPLGHENKNLPVYCGIPANLEVSLKGGSLNFQSIII
jgi:muramoyltetrapeptide carboxypeptidase